MPLPGTIMRPDRRTAILERLQRAIRAEADGVNVTTYDLGHLAGAYRRSAEVRNCLAAFDPANVNRTAGPDDPLPNEAGFVRDSGVPYAASVIDADESGPDGTGETDDEGNPLPRTPVPRTPAELARQNKEDQRPAEADPLADDGPADPEAAEGDSGRLVDPLTGNPTAPNHGGRKRRR